MRQTAVPVRMPKGSPYTVVLECPDPVVPVCYSHGRSLASMRRLFDRLRQIEIARGGGGEFTLSLYEHTPASTLTCHADDDGVVYWFAFAGSKKLLEFTYMDLMEIKVADVKVGACQAVGA